MSDTTEEKGIGVKSTVQIGTMPRKGTTTSDADLVELLVCAFAACIAVLVVTTSTILTFIGVTDDLSAVGLIFGCSVSPQTVNTPPQIETLTTFQLVTQTTVDSSCTLECAAGHKWHCMHVSQLGK